MECAVYSSLLRAPIWEVKRLEVCLRSAEEYKNNLITVPPYLNLK